MGIFGGNIYDKIRGAIHKAIALERERVANAQHTERAYPSDHQTRAHNHELASKAKAFLIKLKDLEKTLNAIVDINANRVLPEQQRFLELAYNSISQYCGDRRFFAQAEIHLHNIYHQSLALKRRQV